MSLNSRVFQLFKVQITKQRLYSSVQLDIKPATKLIKQRKEHDTQLEKYFQSSVDLQKVRHLIPARFLKRNRKAPDDLYLVDRKVGETIAASLMSRLCHKADKTIIETNPGFGFVTKELLDAGVDKIQLYDTAVCFRDYIHKLDEEYPNALKLFDRDFFSIWKLSYQDRHDNGDRVKRLMSGIEIKEWTDEPTMTIIGTLASSNFVRHLMLSLIFQFGVMTYGRCELFLIMPPPLYLQLTAGPETGFLLYRGSSVLFQAFCHVEILKKLPRKAFLPWDNTRDQSLNLRTIKVNHVDPNTMYLTRIEFKRDLPVPPHRLQHFWYFVLHMMISRTKRVIPMLEKWIPGCGTRLIITYSSKNAERNPNSFPDINIFTKVGEMSPAQILHLYKDFSSWPEYTESSFIEAMESAMVRMDNGYYPDGDEQLPNSDTTKNEHLDPNIVDNTPNDDDNR